MRYHGGSIENTCCHKPSSIVTKSIGIYDHFRVSPSQSLLMISTHTQYPLNIEGPCNIVAWWIMTINSLISWFTISFIQCVSHTLVNSPWETHPDGQDKSFLQLGGGTLQSLLMPKSMNWLWTIYLLTRNSLLVSSMQLLVHLCHV